MGSGASAVHFALSALQKGHEVTMLDVGREGPPPVSPDLTFTGLKEKLPDPAAYFLGEKFEGVLYPGSSEEYYGFPPHRQFIFEGVPQFRTHPSGFAPLFSFAQGGLAEAWTGGAFPFTREEMEDFPVAYDELAPYYGVVAGRIGICGAADDLARFLPVHDHLDPPLDLDDHSRLLLERYEKRRDRLNSTLRCYMGRSRVAVTREDRGERKGCDYIGRCLWGCPRDSLYVPSLTLKECRKQPGFTYMPGFFASHFKAGAGGCIGALVAEPARGGPPVELPVETLVLGGGTLSTARIFLESVRRESGKAVRLTGLMDNQQMLMPFISPAMIGKPYDPETYQYHQLALGIEGARPKDYIHGLVTTLKTALCHPIVQNVPFDFRTSLFIFRNVHSALGLVNINLNDTRRDENFVGLESDAAGPGAALTIRYVSGPREAGRIADAMKKVNRVLRALGCIVPPGMTHIRPMGASVHYAGTLPMSAIPGPLTTSKDCRSHDFENLLIVDGSTLPFLPAKNVTFTLMANAARVADVAF